MMHRLFVGVPAATLAIALLALLAAVGWPADSAQGKVVKAWEFNKDGDLEGWRPNNHMKDVEVSGGTLKFTVVNWDPILATDAFDEPIPATPTQVIEIRLKSPGEGTAEFFWTNTTEGKYQGFSQGKETKFKVEPGWHTYRLKPFWQGEGKIIKLRFDPPGVQEGIAEPARYEVDYIRVIELGPAGKPVEAKWDFAGGTQGWQVEGEGSVAAERGWLVARLGKGARLVAPPVEVNAYEDVFVSFVMAVDRGSSGRVFFASGKANGLHSVSFRTIADGKPHVYNVPVSVNAGWKAPVIYIAIEPATDEACTARLDWVRTAPEPVGPPELEIRRLMISDALPRAERPCEVLMQIANRGGKTLRGLKAELHLPASARMANGEQKIKPVDELDYYEPAEVRWNVVASRPGPLRLLVTVSGEAAAKAEATEKILPPLHLPKASYVPEPKPVHSEYDIGIYYFPGWWSWARWQPIMNYPERRPVLGWYKEGLPEVADWHIKFAVEHGVKFFCYDWYWDRGRIRLEHALHDGFFHARYRHLLKFCLLWANHAPTVHTPEDNVKVCQYWIDNYFKRPEYYKVNGRPLIVIFSIWAMKRDLGIEGSRKAIELWHKMTREAGVGEVMVAGCGRGGSVLKMMKDMGFDAVTGYNWPSCGVAPGRNFVPYIEVARKQFDLWWMPMAKENLMPVITPTSPGWDARPWHGKKAFVLTDRTPEAFEEHLRLAKRFIDETGQPKVLLIEAWNEFGEGSYCEPHKEYAFGHLDAVRRVFCPQAGDHVDFGPADVGLGPYDCERPPMKTAWEFNTDGDAEGWGAMMGLAEFKVEGGVMKAKTISHDPAFACATRLRAKKYRTVEIRMSLTGKQETDTAQLFWATTLTATSEPASVRFKVPVDGKMHTFRLDVGANKLWRGVITKLRFDPCCTRDTEVAIDYIRVLP